MENIRGHLKETELLLSDILQSGVSAVQQPMLERLKNIALVSAQFGMTELATEEKRLAELIESGRHSFDDNDMTLIDCLFKISRYVKLALKKSDTDLACKRLKERKSNED